MAKIRRVKGKNVDPKDLQRKFNRLKKDLPVILVNRTERHFKQGFRRGGKMTDSSSGGWKDYTNARYKKWKQRGGKKRSILVLSGALRRDIQRRRVSFKRTSVGTYNLPYAKIHNEGGPGIAFGKYKFTMPKREFIGPSRKLHGQLKRDIQNEIKIVFRNAGT